jgi:hypothetical protein
VRPTVRSSRASEWCNPHLPVIGLVNEREDKMIRHRFFVFALAIVVLSTDVAAVAQADVFDEWNVHAEQAIVITGAQNPAVASLSFAIFQGAVYDAVNAIDRRFTPFISQFNAPAGASLDAAIAAAAHGVLLGLFPA